MAFNSIRYFKVPDMICSGIRHILCQSYIRAHLLQKQNTTIIYRIYYCSNLPPIYINAVDIKERIHCSRLTNGRIICSNPLIILVFLDNIYIQTIIRQVTSHDSIIHGFRIINDPSTLPRRIHELHGIGGAEEVGRMGVILLGQST